MYRLTSLQTASRVKQTKNALVRSQFHARCRPGRKVSIRHRYVRFNLLLGPITNFVLN